LCRAGKRTDKCIPCAPYIIYADEATIIGTIKVVAIEVHITLEWRSWGYALITTAYPIGVANSSLWFYPTFACSFHYSSYKLVQLRERDATYCENADFLEEVSP